MKFFAKHGARISVMLLPLLFALGHATNALNISLAQTLDPRIVIVDFDEKSLSEIGR